MSALAVEEVCTLVCFCCRRGYADGEIEAMFARYDVDGDRVLDEEEQRRMQADLFEQKVLNILFFLSPISSKSLLMNTE